MRNIKEGFRAFLEAQGGLQQVLSLTQTGLVGELH